MPIRIIHRLVLVGLVLCFYPGSALSASLPQEKGKIKGVIHAVRYGQPLAEPYFVLAYMDVDDGRGNIVTFEVNRDTQIRDNYLRKANVRFLKEGKQVRVEYGVYEDRPVQVALAIYENEKGVPRYETYK